MFFVIAVMSCESDYVSIRAGDPPSFFADPDPAVFPYVDQDPAAFSMQIRIQFKITSV